MRDLYQKRIFFSLPPPLLYHHYTYLPGAAFQVPMPSSHLEKGKGIKVTLISPFRSPEMIGRCSCFECLTG